MSTPSARSNDCFIALHQEKFQDTDRPKNKRARNTETQMFRVWYGQFKGDDGDEIALGPFRDLEAAKQALGEHPEFPSPQDPKDHIFEKAAK